MKRTLLVVAFAAIAAFLVVLALEVPSPDLIAVIVFTLILVAYDFLLVMRNRRD